MAGKARASIRATLPATNSMGASFSGRDSTQSPKLLTHKRTYSDEASQMRVAPPRSLLDLQGHLDAASRSSLCVNGSHIYNEEPQAPLRHRSSISGPFPPSSSLHSVSFRPAEEGSRPTDDSGGRGSRSTSSSEMLPGQEELSSQAKVLATGTSRSGEEEGARLPEGKPVQVATPLVASSESVAEKEGARKEERKPRMGLFHHHHQGLSRSELGRRGSLGEKGGPTQGASPHHSSGGEEKAKSSWFGLREAKEPTQKPRYVLGKTSFAPWGGCWGIAAWILGQGGWSRWGPWAGCWGSGFAWLNGGGYHFPKPRLVVGTWTQVSCRGTEFWGPCGLWCLVSFSWVSLRELPCLPPEGGGERGEKQGRTFFV